MKAQNFSWKKASLCLWLSALLIVGLLCLLFFFYVTPKTTVDVILLGDSTIGITGDGEGIDVYLAEASGLSVLRAGFGGTTAAYQAESASPSAITPHLSLVSLTDAIVTGDFSLQKSQIALCKRYNYILINAADYFPATIKALSKVDFSKASYLVITYGINDYNGGIPLDNAEDPFDIGTYGGALRYSLLNLQTAYPNLTIILTTSNWFCFSLDGVLTTCEEADFGYGTLADYAALMAEIAAEYDVALLDNYTDSGINAETYETYLFDGMHPGAEGQKLLANRLANLIARLGGDHA